ncbi:N-acetylglucosamine 6-phosphate deacetylase [Sphingomonas sp. PP-CE-3G-477]|uniref:N-acetylglucosamine-6-phosphate deacetylase n=1 Tax=Sphingomonas sp. PP-CE-3G-477 TaxID=2135660 RepID=UPI000D3854F2|nr:N-acetylglucosamine-6-phosphate deacetylase [Sphingomonas sp. PP-CE-3G-477]PTQ65394.1 N-acetylglucosamine 6-phosphate deacetylase [Sphingomonas sp. PP-CE-3G-477]
MTTYRFSNGHIAASTGVLHEATIVVEDGRITQIGDATSDQAVDHAIDLDGGWLMPGFVDTQVNGGGGVLFNDTPTVEGIAAIGAAHRPFGTTAFLPTLISDTPDVIARALDAVDAAILAGVPGVLGIHIEGPVISPARKGIHDPTRFQDLDDDLLALLTRPRLGRVMVTLAPERVTAAQIATLTAAGVLISIGHSDADHATASAGMAAGITGVTHLFNAMSPLVHRAPGVVGAVLDDQAVYCGIIVDGFHVDDAVLRIALRARPHDRFMLVSDAMPCVGAAEKSFVLQGREIHVENGRCVGADGTLAGSDLDMAGAVRNTVDRLGVAPEIAAAMAATYPAAFLRLSQERGTLQVGRTADWVVLTRDLHPVGTWIGGESAA